MSASRPDRSPESEEQRKKRVGSERLGAMLFVIAGSAGIFAAVHAVANYGILAEVKLRASDRGLPWFVVLPIGLFGVLGGVWALWALSRGR